MVESIGEDQSIQPSVFLKDDIVYGPWGEVTHTEQLAHPSLQLQAMFSKALSDPGFFPLPVTP